MPNSVEMETCLGDVVKKRPIFIIKNVFRNQYYGYVDNHFHAK